MNQTEHITGIQETFDHCLEIVRKKSMDYATHSDPFKNFSTSTVVGVDPARAILVRIMDKITRISNLLDKENDVSGETIFDSIYDNINYLAILGSLLKDKYGHSQEA